MRSQYCAVLFVFALGLLTSSGVMGETITTDQNTTGYTVASDDLLQTEYGSMSFSGNSLSRENCDGEPALRDGLFGALGGRSTNGGDTATAGSSEDPLDILIYTLDTSVNTLGYDLSGITTYAGWDGQRYGQKYDLYAHQVGDDASTFSLLKNISYRPTAIAGGINNTKVAIAFESTEATGVDQLKFVFHREPGYDWIGYREIDVMGVAIQTPEPSTLVMLSMGLISLIAYAWRKRK